MTEDERMIPETQPGYPGAFIQEYILDEISLTQAQLATLLGVSRRTINQLVNGKRKVTAEMALRLVKFTRTSPELWLNLQMRLDLWEALQNLEPSAIQQLPLYTTM
jgi:addiction module HigA family antidote